MFSGLPVLKQYLEGNLSWIFHVKPSFKINEVGECLNRPKRASLVNFPSLVFNVNIANGAIMNHWNQEHVLVSPIKQVNGPNGNIPSIVRLYLAKEKSAKVAMGDIYFLPFQKAFKTVRGRINGKLGLPPVSHGDQSRNGLEPRMIKSTLEIMDGIPKSQSKFIDKCTLRSVCKIALDKFAASFRIHMGSHNQSFFQAVDSGLDTLDVMVGPCDLVSGGFVDRH